MQVLPSLFLTRLQKIIPSQHFDVCCKTFLEERPLSLRVNTLRVTTAEITGIFKKNQINYEQIGWCPEALVLKNTNLHDPQLKELIDGGYLYAQSLSSILVSLVLNPVAGENVLDMCAAPGSKATHLAALMHNQGSILAVEKVKERYYKLKRIVSLLGAEIIASKLMDARRLRLTEGIFDKILIDAPCSCEGRFKIYEKKTYAFWSLRKIKEMVRKQKGLLLCASRLLKPGGNMVYATCTFSPEENEGVVDWFLKKTKTTMQILPIDFPDVGRYQAIALWPWPTRQRKVFDEQISCCLRVLPDGPMEGFFIAKFQKRKTV